MAKASVTKKDKYELIRETILEHTTEWNVDEYVVDDKQSQAAKDLSKLLSEMTFVKEDKGRFAKMFSLISKENVIVEEDEDLKLRVLTALVILKADKHNYTTGDVVISDGQGTAVKPDGSVGNFIKPSRKIVRPATDAEMAAIPEVQLKGLLDVVNIVFSKSKE